MQVFEYGQTEIDYLKRKDKKLAALIDQVGMIERAITPDPFAALVTSVIGQQISSKAAQTVSEQLCQLVGTITPDSIAAADLAAIQACGMTMKKPSISRGLLMRPSPGQLISMPCVGCRMNRSSNSCLLWMGWGCGPPKCC